MSLTSASQEMADIIAQDFVGRIKQQIDNSAFPVDYSSLITAIGNIDILKAKLGAVVTDLQEDLKVSPVQLTPVP